MLREIIKNGEIVLGTMLSEFGCPNLVRIMKTGGFAFVIIDCEHGPFDFSQLSAMIAVGNSIGMPVLVRIPGIERGYITKILDMGADGFLIPMVNTAEEARKIVEFSKYAPVGKRGISTTRAHTGYHPPKLDNYMKSANGRTILLVQIETAEAVEHAEEIAAVPGIDALIVGPSDLSSDLGVAGKLDSGILLENAKKVAQAAKKQGKVSGTVATNTKYLHACREMGMTVFNMGSELGMLLKEAQNHVATFEKEVVE